MQRHKGIGRLRDGEMEQWSEVKNRTLSISPRFRAFVIFVTPSNDEARKFPRTSNSPNFQHSDTLSLQYPFRAPLRIRTTYT